MIVVPGVALLDPIPEKNQWQILATVAATQAKDSAGNYCYELWVWHFNCYMDVSTVRHEALTFSLATAAKKKIHTKKIKFLFVKSHKIYSTGGFIWMVTAQNISTELKARVFP